MFEGFQGALSWVPRCREVVTSQAAVGHASLYKKFHFFNLQNYRCFIPSIYRFHYSLNIVAIASTSRKRAKISNYYLGCETPKPFSQATSVQIRRVRILSWKQHHWFRLKGIVYQFRAERAVGWIGGLSIEFRDKLHQGGFSWNFNSAEASATKARFTKKVFQSLLDNEFFKRNCLASDI